MPLSQALPQCHGPGRPSDHVPAAGPQCKRLSPGPCPASEPRIDSTVTDAGLGPGRGRTVTVLAHPTGTACAPRP
eukprot:766583-Hanusia_phi.AAC.7